MNEENIIIKCATNEDIEDICKFEELKSSKISIGV